MWEAWSLSSQCLKVYNTLRPLTLHLSKETTMITPLPKVDQTNLHSFSWRQFSCADSPLLLCLSSPGAGYDDSTAGQEKEDDAVFPGGYYEYVWDISPKDGPTASDPECLTYSYSSQVDTVRDANSGLIGALLICKSSQCVGGQRGAFLCDCLT